jgi:predicted transcriptional regulator
MAETKESQENLAYIRTHVDNLERLVRFQISADPDSRKAIRERFAQREGMAEVYLALREGPRTQDELAVNLKRSVPTISKILKQLAEEGMVAKMPSPQSPKKMVYRWTDLEEMLKVSKIAIEFLATKSELKSSKYEPDQPTTENAQADESDSQQ